MTMTPERPAHRSAPRGLPALGRLLTGAALAAVLLALSFSGTLVWWLRVEPPTAFERRPEGTAQIGTVEEGRLRAKEARSSLEAAARDGRLSDEEIDEAVGPGWVARHASDGIEVEASFDVGGPPPQRSCFRYAVPLDPVGEVRQWELDDSSCAPAPP